MGRVFRLVEAAAIGVLLLLTFLILMQVLMRNFLGTGFSWMEEMARYLLLTMVLITGSVIVYRNEHVAVDFFVTHLPTRFRRPHALLVNLIMLVFFGLYVRSHLMFMARSGNVNSPSLVLPNRVYFAAGLVGAVLSIAALLWSFFVALRRKGA